MDSLGSRVSARCESFTALAGIVRTHRMFTALFYLYNRQPPPSVPGAVVSPSGPGRGGLDARFVCVTTKPTLDSRHRHRGNRSAVWHLADTSARVSTRSKPAIRRRDAAGSDVTACRG